MVVDIPNCIAGSFEQGENKRILKDYTGKDTAQISHPTPAQLRRAKRTIAHLESPQSIPLSDIIHTIQKAVSIYYPEEQLRLCSALTGMPYQNFQKTLEEFRDWVENIEDYLTMAFGTPNYTRIPLLIGDEEIAYEKYVAQAPLIAILPRNSEIEAAYVIVQALLARTPMIIKSPSTHAGPLSAIELVRALEKTVDPDLKKLIESISIVSMPGTNREEIIERLAIDDSTYLIFGSEKTIQTVTRSLEKHEPRKIISMGTGLSVSIIAHDAPLDEAAEEVCLAAASDQGNECLSTNIVYVHEQIADVFTERLKEKAHEYTAGDPFSDTLIGAIHPDDTARIAAATRHLPGSVRGLPETVHLSVFELEDHHHFEEYPGPLIGIRTYQNEKDLEEKFKGDLTHNGLKKNLVTAIFTNDPHLVDHIVERFPSHTFRHNRGSHRMNFLLEHQSIYLIKEFLDKRIVEISR